MNPATDKQSAVDTWKDKAHTRRRGNRLRRDDSLFLVTAPSGEVYSLEFIWTISRAYETEGYNICTLYLDGYKAARCLGGGYDMRGTNLADWFMQVERERITAMAQADISGQYYGLYWSAEHGARLDGACGMSSVEAVMKALGYALRYVR